MDEPVILTAPKGDDTFVITAADIAASDQYIATLEDGQTVDFEDIDVLDTQVTMSGNDLVMFFADGTSLILQNFIGLAVNGSFLELNFNGESTVNSDYFLQRIDAYFSRSTAEDSTTITTGTNAARATVDDVEIPLNALLSPIENSQPEPESELKLNPEPVVSPDSTPDPEPTTEPENIDTNVWARLSNATDNQTTVNSGDHYKLETTLLGQNETVAGSEMDITGVGENAEVNFSYNDKNTLDASLMSPWNSVKNIEIFSNQAADVTLDNFVHTNVTLRGNDDSHVNINNAKRGDIRTGSGDDSVTINAFSNNAGWSNNFNVISRGGDDDINLAGDKGLTTFTVKSGKGDDTVTMTNDAYASSTVRLGKGDDIFIGGAGADTVKGGKGNDSIAGGGGDDKLYGGKGDDTLVGHTGIDTIRGGRGNDTIEFDGLDSLIHGGRGADTLATTGSDLHIDLANNNIRQIEHIDLTNIVSTLHVTAQDIDRVSEFDGLFVAGVAGASITAGEFTNRGENVNYDDITYATYSTLTDDSPILFIEIGLSLNGNDVVIDVPIHEGNAEMTFITEEAGYKNTVGFYNVTEDGSIVNVHIGFDNASLQGKDHIDAGDTADMGSYTQGDAFEVFIIANGYNHNNQFKNIDTDEGTFSFINSDGDPANINDTGPLSLIHNAESGEQTTLNGHIYHTENENLNDDGDEHAIVSSTEDGDGIRIHFEDLHNLGDRDYDDVVVDIHLDGASATVAGETVNDSGDAENDFGIIDLSAVGGVTILNDDNDFDENEGDDDDGNSDLLEISIIMTDDHYDMADVIDDDPNVMF
ncbi:MAG: Ca2+-binding RTX toxin-like protein [Alphaproteobacteria bacterium]|jgi:Ca2+-binding RTX toxin-like protein